MSCQAREVCGKFVGGVRVSYFNRLAEGEIWLLLVYPKSGRENLPAQVLHQLKEEIENA